VFVYDMVNLSSAGVTTHTVGYRHIILVEEDWRYLWLLLCITSSSTSVQRM